MSEEQSKLQADREMLQEAQQGGTLKKLGVYTKLSGPGWLQSALTLGGGSLSSSLYLGILAGFTMLWVQPIAMIMGIIMLSAISYVTLSTGERPFRAINNHVNPVLGWSWLLASLAANIVWVLPQYSLCYGVIEQNLAPGLFGEDGALAGTMGKYAVSGLILAVSIVVVWSYGSGSWGIKLYEVMLKIVVALIVGCFVAVVIQMSLKGEQDWGALWAGFIPDLNQLFEPAERFQVLLDKIQDQSVKDYWTAYIVNEQRDVMISAAATAVGINMTFLLPYSMLSRGWDKNFRGLAVFDLSTGMFIPFVIATSCVIMAAASQFHTEIPTGIQWAEIDESKEPEEDGAKPIFKKNGNRLRKVEDLNGLDEHGLEKNYVVDFSSITREGLREDLQKQYNGLIKNRDIKLTKEDQASTATSLREQMLAASLIKRDVNALAKSLSNLVGEGAANYVFGFGVLAMAMSSISLLMLISGFIVCEVMDKPTTGWPLRLGCLLAATGIFWPIFWGGGVKAYLAIVTSLYGSMLLPIAYFTFYLLINQKSLLKENAPAGTKKIVWNALMALAVFVASVSSVYVIWKKTAVQFGSGWYGIGIIVAFFALVIYVQIKRKYKPIAESSVYIQVKKTE